jgi:hypothetical protein
LNNPSQNQWFPVDLVHEKSGYIKNLKKISPFVLWSFSTHSDYKPVGYNKTGIFWEAKLFGGDQGIRLIDLNNDRQVDLVRLFWDENIGQDSWIYINTGSEWDMSQHSNSNKKWNETMPPQSSQISFSSDCPYTLPRFCFSNQPKHIELGFHDLCQIKKVLAY